MKNIRSPPAHTYNSNVFKILLVLCIFLLTVFPINANAIAVVEVNEIDTPQGAVLLIAEGLGSGYIYPEKIPYALDRSMLEKATVNNLTLITDSSFRAINVEVPEMKTDVGHSIIITGCQKARPPMIDYESSTVYDVAHDHGFLVIGVLEEGDFDQMLSQQDIAVHDSTGSINEPEMRITTGEYGNEDPILSDVLDLMNENAASSHDYVQSRPSGSIERYHAYNNWALKTGMDVMELMKSTDKRYILTIDIAALETAGRYRGNSGYVEAIEGLDDMLPQLYNKCQEHNVALIITSCYGMAFPDMDSRGGSKSEKYSDQPEVRQVPLVIYSKNIENNTLENADLHDIAPSLLSVLDLPDELHFSSGVNRVTKDYANIKVNLPEVMDIKLSRDNQQITDAQKHKEYIFTGLEKNAEYTIEALSPDGESLKETIFLDSDTVVYLQSYDPGNSTTPSEGEQSDGENHKTLGSAIIVVINLFGITLIIRIMRE